MSTLLFLYLIGQADTIIAFFVMSALVCVLVGGFGTIISFAESGHTSKWFPSCIGIAVFCALIACVFPNKNTMMMMAGGQAVMEVIHNPDVEKIAGSSAKVIENYLDGIIHDQDSKKEKK